MLDLVAAWRANKEGGAMMNEPKAFASLSAGLLARKGGARPAMRRQPLGMMELTVPSTHDDLGWNDMGYDVDPDLNTPMAGLDLKPLLPGSVMGAMEERPEDAAAWGALAASETPVPEVVRQRESLAERLAAPMQEKASFDVTAQAAPKREAPRGEARAKRVKAAPQKAATTKAEQHKTAGPKARDKAAFTLRLDAERHLRLRLASAVTNQSSQMILTALLDEYLASLPEIGELASRVPALPPARIARAG
jgi:hypothetical protein